MGRGKGSHNPYTPGMGTRPPFLAGRDSELEYFDELLDQLSAGGTEKHLILTGLRGVGKTVLLNELEVKCEERGWPGEATELRDGSSIGREVSKAARKALLQLSSAKRTLDGLRRAMRVVHNFSVSVGEEVTFKIDLDPIEGIADSGDLGADLRDLLVEVGQAAEKHGSGFALILDEMHFLPRRDLEALIMGLHRAQQKSLPVALVGGGLPLLPELTGKAKTYAERGLEFRSVGALSREASVRALREPAIQQGIDWSDEAIDRVTALTGGYPFFLQEYGRQIWKLGEGRRIELAEVTAAEPLVLEYLDASFFSQRIGKLPGLERRYVSAMARLGDGPQRSGDVAAALGRNVKELSPIRARLIESALIYSPARGEVDFTVPLCADHIRRTYPLRTEQRP